MHNGLVGVAGEKMSKSLGNSLLVDAMVTQVRPVELRYYLGQAHYRSAIEYSPEALDEAVAAYRRIEGFGRPAPSELSGDAPDPAAAGRDALPPAFAAALDDDLAVPQALAVVHETVRDGNNALAAGDTAAAAAALAPCGPCSLMLGLDPLARRGPPAAPTTTCAAWSARWSRSRSTSGRRRSDRKDYEAADAISDRLRAAGLLIEDTPRGPRWDDQAMSRRWPQPVGCAGRSPRAHAGGVAAERRSAGRPGRPAPARGGRAHQVRQAARGHRGPRQTAAGGQGADPARAPAARAPRAAPGRGRRPRGHGPWRGRVRAGAPVLVLSRPRERRRGRGARAAGSVRQQKRRHAVATGGCLPRGGGRGRAARGDAAEIVAGRNAVLEALRAGVPATALLRGPAEGRRRPGARGDRRSPPGGPPMIEAGRAELDRLTGGAVHQGLALRIGPTRTPRRRT